MGKAKIKKEVKQGKITIPPEIIKAVEWREGQEVEFIIDKNQIIIKPFERSCIFCGKSTDDLFYGKPICKYCRFQIVHSTKFIHELE